MWGRQFVFWTPSIPCTDWNNGGVGTPQIHTLKEKFINHSHRSLTKILLFKLWSRWNKRRHSLVRLFFLHSGTNRGAAGWRARMDKHSQIKSEDRTVRSAGWIHQTLKSRSSYASKPRITTTFYPSLLSLGRTVRSAGWIHQTLKADQTTHPNHEWKQSFIHLHCL